MDAVVELLVTAHPDAPHRIVRVASSGPFALVTAWIGAPDAGVRRMRLHVTAERSTPETLRRRLDRVVDVLEVQVVG